MGIVMIILFNNNKPFIFMSSTYSQGSKNFKTSRESNSRNSYSKKQDSEVLANDSQSVSSLHTMLLNPHIVQSAKTQSLGNQFPIQKYHPSLVQSQPNIQVQFDSQKTRRSKLDSISDIESNRKSQHNVETRSDALSVKSLLLGAPHQKMSDKMSENSSNTSKSSDKMSKEKKSSGFLLPSEWDWENLTEGEAFYLGGPN